MPNVGQLPYSYGQSKVSYSRHLSAVSLFDFDTADEAFVFDQEWKWGTVLFKSLPDIAVAIRIRRKALDPTKLLLPNEISKGDARLASLPDGIRKMGMCIPDVEALHLGPISVSTFTGFILIATEKGDYLWNEVVAAGAEALGVLSTIGAGWISEYERRTAERHARGEYTLAEELEAAIRKAESNR